MGASRRVFSDWETALGLRREAQFFDEPEAAVMRRAALKYAGKLVIEGGNVQVPARREAREGVQSDAVSGVSGVQAAGSALC